MSHRIFGVASVLVALAIPLGACQTASTGTGAATGAIAGAAVGGPVGAVVGGAAGAAVGASLSPADAGTVRQYVVTQRRPSVRLREEVVVGAPLPTRVRLYTIPANVGVTTEYRYAVVNNQTVLVDPMTREVIQVLD